MKNLILISVLVLTTISSVFSQSPNDKVFKIGEDINSVNTGYLSQLIFTKINKMLMEKGIPQLSFDKATYKAAAYQTKFFNKYVEYRNELVEGESVDGMFLQKPQDRLDFYSKEEGVGRRIFTNTGTIPCVNCGLNAWYRMTYDELSDDYVRMLLDENDEDLTSIINSKYMGVSVRFDIEGINIYMLTITTLTSINDSESL
jgi:hypothetical protein